MSRLLSLAMFLILSACGGPASPDGGSSAQSLVNNMTPDIQVNGVTVQPGSTTNVTVGTKIYHQVNFRNNSGQTLHTAFVAVRGWWIRLRV